MEVKQEQLDLYLHLHASFFAQDPFTQMLCSYSTGQEQALHSTHLLRLVL